MSATAVELQQLSQTSNAASSTSQDARATEPASLKRKRDEAETVDLDFKDIHIRPFPGSIYDKPIHLRPLRILPRARLPLSFLDTSANASAISVSRLFSAHIGLLEHKDNTQDQARVLIAGLDNANDLYAVERVKPRVYALCRLCSWVQLSYIEDGSSAMLGHMSPALNEGTADKWWTYAVVQPIASAPNKKRIRLSMGASSKSPIAPDISTARSSTTSTPTVRHDVNRPLAPETIAVEAPIEPPKTDEEIFETLIRQYLEAIYVSKTSMAFFAKGPLSRARNAFTNGTNTGLLSTMTVQLRAMLLSMSQMDKKYKEKLPEVVKSFPAHALSEDELDGPVKTKKRRSKKLPKLSREGYYPIEEDYCKRWWADQSASARAREDETFDQLLRRRSGDLRRRETLAQITLILEVLALESTPGFEPTPIANADTQLGETQMPDDMSQAQINTDSTTPIKPKRRPKKPQDLNLILELLLDKLSIWQSIEQDISDVLDVDRKRDTVAENNDKLQEHDILVGFCVDVVIPFYKSRIPTQASLVNKKLGGPGAVSPEKMAKPKPAPKRPGDRRSRQPLQKTLSETNGFIRSRPPSLSRSATDTQAMSRFKREASEVSLFEIPAARLSHRDSSSQLRHLQRQQVDLTALSTATDAKLKRKAQTEKDLKEAIGNIARPNRSQAVLELADAADKRSLGSASMRKKTMAPVKKVLQSVRNVQVTATPKHKRSQKHAMLEVDAQEQQHAPSSGDFCVPSSGIRALSDVIGATPAAAKTSSNPFTITSTPSKAATASRPSFQDFMRSQMARKPTVATPLKITKSAIVDSTPIMSSKIFATPAKQPLASSPPAFPLAETTPLKQPDARTSTDEPSIYDALGWNDYDE